MLVNQLRQGADVRTAPFVGEISGLWSRECLRLAAFWFVPWNGTAAIGKGSLALVGKETRSRRLRGGRTAFWVSARFMSRWIIRSREVPGGSCRRKCGCRHLRLRLCWRGLGSEFCGLGTSTAHCTEVLVFGISRGGAGVGLALGRCAFAGIKRWRIRILGALLACRTLRGIWDPCSGPRSTAWGWRRWRSLVLEIVKSPLWINFVGICGFHPCEGNFLDAATREVDLYTCLRS